MSAFIQDTCVMDVRPDDVTLAAHARFAVLRIGPQVSAQPATFRGANADVGMLMQLGERIARDARRAGHAHRTALRSARLLEALERCKAVQS